MNINDILKKEGPFTVKDMLEMAQLSNNLSSIILDRYLKMVQFLEEKGLYTEFGIWFVERFESEQNKEQN